MGQKASAFRVDYISAATLCHQRVAWASAAALSWVVSASKVTFFNSASQTNMEHSTVEDSTPHQHSTSYTVCGVTFVPSSVACCKLSWEYFIFFDLMKVLKLDIRYRFVSFRQLRCCQWWFLCNNWIQMSPPWLLLSARCNAELCPLGGDMWAQMSSSVCTAVAGLAVSLSAEPFHFQCHFTV